jgi:hypothetical protein
VSTKVGNDTNHRFWLPSRGISQTKSKGPWSIMCRRISPPRDPAASVRGYPWLAHWLEDFSWNGCLTVLLLHIAFAWIVCFTLSAASTPSLVSSRTDPLPSLRSATLTRDQLRLDTQSWYRLFDTLQYEVFGFSDSMFTYE